VTKPDDAFYTAPVVSGSENYYSLFTYGDSGGGNLLGIDSRAGGFRVGWGGRATQDAALTEPGLSIVGLTFPDGAQTSDATSYFNGLAGSLSLLDSPPKTHIAIDTARDTAQANIGRNHLNENSYDGGISEVIVFGTEVSSTVHQQVQSYLALKYGITLDQTTPTDYVSSGDATSTVTMWDASAAV